MGLVVCVHDFAFYSHGILFDLVWLPNNLRSNCSKILRQMIKSLQYFLRLVVQLNIARLGRRSCICLTVQPFSPFISLIWHFPQSINRIHFGPNGSLFHIRWKFLYIVVRAFFNVKPIFGFTLICARDSVTENNVWCESEANENTLPEIIWPQKHPFIFILNGR